jgi:hypothetical protein
MILMVETTKWDTPNHSYIIENKSSGKMIGYIPNGTDTPILFKKPLSFSRSRRTFKEIKINL